MAAKLSLRAAALPSMALCSTSGCRSATYVTLLDAYALVAFLVGGPAAPQVRAILREGDAALASAKLAEALDVSQRVYGLSINRAMEVIDPLLESALSLVPLDLTVARGAARIRAEYYHCSSRPITWHIRQATRFISD